MIEINNLSKSYGINKIFENESITLTNSCIYALVGVNGIGKSTFLNSIIQPSTLDKGSVKIDDIPSTDFTAKYHYAFVPDTKDMFLNLTGKEYLQFVSELYNQKEKFDELLAIYIPKLKLENSLEQTISSYSLGMKQKIYLAGAFMSNAQNISISFHYVDFIFYNRAIRVGFVHWACYLGWNSYNLFFYQTQKNKLGESEL